jgi:tRNA(Ile)-lysidine synthase
VDVAEVRELVRATGMLAGRTHLVAMLSGGRDSVCLLDVAVALCGAGGVHALHVNYGVREEAAADESSCRQLCEVLGVDLIVARSGRCPDAAGNFHAWAREFRYRRARELAERLDEAGVGESPGDAAPDFEVAAGGEGEEGEEGVGDLSKNAAPRVRVGHPFFEGLTPAPVAMGHAPTLIATGHTSTDQVETILYRLASSPGRRALLGMPAREGRLVRPLLALTREQTADYCLLRGLRWREDASNDSPSYARARVRHDLLPALDAVHPAARPNVLRTAQLLREETRLLDSLVSAELGGRDSIALERLGELPSALQRLVTIRLAEDAAGTYVPQAGDRVAEILALGLRGGRAELHVGGLASAVVEDGELRMVRIPPREQHCQ